MAVRKVTVSLDQRAWEAAERGASAEHMSLSAWLSVAALELARIQSGLRGVAEYEAEFGAFTQEERNDATRRFEELGVGMPVPPEEGARWEAALGRLRGDDGPAARKSA